MLDEAVHSDLAQTHPWRRPIGYWGLQQGARTARPTLLVQCSVAFCWVLLVSVRLPLWAAVTNRCKRLWL